ncbi:MAG: hypothetical protein K1X51_00450 [Rhodospirillaceae bacterium]|nr:hypothetical protein [Rhodospirillaceae bacterium]
MKLPVLMAAVLAPTFALAAPNPLEYAAFPVEIELHKEGKTYFFQNERGKPFYTSDRDEPGKSTCWGKCIEVWAPLLSEAGAKPIGKDWTLIPRELDRMQWVYKGKPVYFNVAENFLGGDAALNNDGHWHVLKP